MTGGYRHDPENTADVPEPDGLLRTGDPAEIRNGRVLVPDRPGETIVLSAAKTFAPTEIETAIPGDPLFDLVCVPGTGRPALSR